MLLLSSICHMMMRVEDQDVKYERLKESKGMSPEIVTWSRILSRHSEILNVKLVHVAGDKNPIRPPQSLCWKSRYLASDSV